MSRAFVPRAAAPPRPLTPNSVHNIQHSFRSSSSPDLDLSRGVHLIPTDLWEAMTGERISQARLCQLCGGSGLVPAQSQASNFHYVDMATDRSGSRSLQAKIQDCSARDRHAIFDALIPRLDELVFDPSANYVIQKLCEFPIEQYESKLLAFFLSDIQHVVEHQNGCRVLQKFIENTSPENVDQLYLALKPSIVHLSYSQNGNHIVQRFIEKLPLRSRELIAELEPDVINLVVDNCGCRVIQKLFDHQSIQLLRGLVDQVLDHAAELATNQFGNYVIQNILEAGPDDDIARLIAAFKGNFSRFSIHKFASNVIEKCIRRALPAQRDFIFREIIGTDGHWEVERILQMSGDQFGNYVIQRIIEFGTAAQRMEISQVVSDNYDDLCKRVYARHVIAKLENHRYDN
jgi:hypothetical protein